MTCNSICDACDTVRHCSQHGCVPVQPAPQSGITNCFVIVKEGDAPFSDRHIWLDGYAIVPLEHYRELEAAAKGGGRA